jgi:hypothetical protein
MYNSNQHYEAHALHLKDLAEQAEQRRMIAALTQYRPARVRAALRRLGVLLERLGTWLAQPAVRRATGLVGVGTWLVSRIDREWRSRYLHQRAGTLEECSAPGQSVQCCRT